MDGSADLPHFGPLVNNPLRLAFSGPCLCNVCSVSRAAKKHQQSPCRWYFSLHSARGHCGETTIDQSTKRSNIKFYTQYAQGRSRPASRFVQPQHPPSVCNLNRRRNTLLRSLPPRDYQRRQTPRRSPIKNKLSLISRRRLGSLRAGLTRKSYSRL